jgi:hypothetical protein
MSLGANRTFRVTIILVYSNTIERGKCRNHHTLLQLFAIFFIKSTNLILLCISS